MARLLVATVPLTGHVHPMGVVARTLVDRGHDVRWYGARKFRAEIEASGATFAPMVAAPDWDDADLEAAIPALRGQRGVRRIQTQLREMFIAPMLDQLVDLTAIHDRFVPDAVIADAAHLGASLLAETRGLPWVGVGVSALMVPSVDTAPFGPGWRPARGPLGRLRNRLLNRFVLRWMFRAVNRAYRRRRTDAGLAAGTATYFDAISPDLFLQPTIPAFEYPRTDLPASVRFIGPLVARHANHDASVPAWWPDVQRAAERGVPVVLVTQGTLATDPDQLIKPTLQALAGEPVLVVATTGGPVQLASPDNARIARYIPYQLLLPHVQVLVTNGGYGGVQMALRHGVPIVVAGGTEEKPEIAARVAWSGAGIDLRTGTPRAAAIRAAVQRVLGEPRFRERARTLAAQIAHHDASTEAALHIEALVHDRPRGDARQAVG